MNGNVFGDRLMTVKEAAAFLGFAEGTIRNKASRGEIQFVKVGRSVRFRSSVIESLIGDEGSAKNEKLAS